MQHVLRTNVRMCGNWHAIRIAYFVFVILYLYAIRIAGTNNLLIVLSISYQKSPIGTQYVQHSNNLKLLVCNAHCVPMTRYWYAMSIAFQKRDIDAQYVLRTNSVTLVRITFSVPIICLVRNAHCRPKYIIGTYSVPRFSNWYALRLAYQ